MHHRPAEFAMRLPAASSIRMLVVSRNARLAAVAISVTTGGGRRSRGRPDGAAVAACDSYADLKKQLGWLGNQIDNPGLAGMLESVLLIATQGRGLGGLDVKRPLGAVVTSDGDRSRRARVRAGEGRRRPARRRCRR
jgi:hypothetical protein